MITFHDKKLFESYLDLLVVYRHFFFFNTFLLWSVKNSINSTSSIGTLEVCNKNVSIQYLFDNIYLTFSDLK